MQSLPNLEISDVRAEMRPTQRSRRARTIGATLLVACACLLPATVHTAGPLEGMAQVVDGDTLQIANQRVHLWGIDAPDPRQICQLDGKPWLCGEAARLALAQHVSHRKVRCDVVAHHGGDDRVARCHVGRDELNRWLVQQGWALDAEPLGNRAYAQTQTRAALEQRGLWQGRFVEPWQWRVHSSAHTASGTATSPPSAPMSD